MEIKILQLSATIPVSGENIQKVGASCVPL